MHATMKKSEIQMRDPFVLPVSTNKKYYLYGTTDVNCWVGPFVGFNVYHSSDLDNWSGPYPAFRPEPGFWADQNFWAPEVISYQGKYYMFASFKTDDVPRGTQILIADKPDGPFRVHSDGPVTPQDWECLDGSFYLDQQDNPWMVFCHEWKQTFDGEMCAIQLSPDLSQAVGEPVFLFKASQAPWAACSKREMDGVERDTYVTDGPYMHRTQDGTLLMLWSSRGNQGYAMGIARSASGEITGPWLHDPEPIYSKDGGHGMIFSSFDQRLFMTIHTPNKTPLERPVFIEVMEAVTPAGEGTLVVKS